MYTDDIYVDISFRATEHFSRSTSGEADALCSLTNSIFTNSNRKSLDFFFLAPR